MLCSSESKENYVTHFHHTKVGRGAVISVSHDKVGLRGFHQARVAGYSSKKRPPHVITPHWNHSDEYQCSRHQRFSLTFMMIRRITSEFFDGWLMIMKLFRQPRTVNVLWIRILRRETKFISYHTSQHRNISTNMTGLYK